MLNNNAQDTLYLDYRVYIDGVEIPFESASISNVYGGLPSASITLPSWPGMVELGRNYAPKVNIFWRDYNFAVVQSERANEGDTANLRNKTRDAYKLIFSGIVTGTTDSKSVSEAGGSLQLTLTCMHPIEVLRDITLRFANQTIAAAQASTGASAEIAVESSEWDLNSTMLKALQGVVETDLDGDLGHVPEGKLDDLKGTPGILRVLWNILKRDSNRPQGADNDSEAMVDMFIPLIEDGLRFWRRMSGHSTIEEGIQSNDGRYQYTGTDPRRGTPEETSGMVMVPGVFRTFIGEAAQQELSITMMNSVLSSVGSVEATSFKDVFNATLEKLEYEMITLSSPVSKRDGSITEYVVKPKLAYYYAPICNVVLPNMLSSITVSSSFNGIPSRVVNLNNITALVNGITAGGSPAQQYVAPHSVRYARAGRDGGNLFGSTNAYNNRVGVYEWGSGIKSSTSHLPLMYNVMQSKLDRQETDAGTLDSSVVGSQYHQGAIAAWEASHPESRWPGRDSYNPLTDASQISAFQRMQFMYVDHDFAMETARSRTAQATGCFNPYAVMGYPMDVIDPVPSRDSYHGLCTSITHSFSNSGQASTSYGLSAVSSFTELAQYNLPAVNPYLMSALNLTNDPRIYGNPEAYQTACQVYIDVFGVGAAEPALLQDYDTGTVIPFTRDGATGCWTTSSSNDFYNTIQGSLILVARNITSLTELEADTGNLFIDIDDWRDTSENDVTYYDNPLTISIANGDVSTSGIDPESSPFLTYVYT